MLAPRELTAGMPGDAGIYDLRGGGAMAAPVSGVSGGVKIRSRRVPAGSSLRHAVKGDRGLGYQTIVVEEC
jgi:hypothetical protein